jgi:hypothetical protein
MASIGLSQLVFLVVAILVVWAICRPHDPFVG